MTNAIKTTVLLVLLTVLIVWIGGLVGGRQGMMIAFLFAVAMNFGSYWFSDKIVLAAYRAREVSERDAPELYRIVHNLSTRAGMPMPRLYVIPGDAANAFATGRNQQHAAVAVTEGITRLMSRDELEGVLAHEISHVRNRDILISSVAATLAGVVMMLANMAQWGAIFGGASRDDREGGGGGGLGLIVVALLAPLAATLIQLAISRSREYQADASGAALLNNGEPLARALEKLGAASQRVPLNASPQTAHMFIVNPLAGRSMAGLFMTHPPLEERIARLRSMRF
ncbi:zinc metalloprotease HtpX [Candidatus Binatia bacterium]|nr:zinc metalloprotease HtpX [Candidatus Binatia bacterium]